MSMILLEPANKITHFNVEIKRRTISLTGRAQLVDATLACSLLAGVSSPRSFAGVIQAQSYLVKIGLRVDGQVGLLREVLS
jgi:hypothetical protein